MSRHMPEAPCTLLSILLVASGARVALCCPVETWMSATRCSMCLLPILVFAVFFATEESDSYYSHVYLIGRMKFLTPIARTPPASIHDCSGPDLHAMACIRWGLGRPLTHQPCKASHAQAQFRIRWAIWCSKITLRS